MIQTATWRSPPKAKRSPPRATTGPRCRTWKRAAELNPRNALAWYLAGEIDAKHHSFADAAEALTKVISLQPSDHDALELREKCYRELGRTADAEADAARRKTLEKK